MKFTFSHCSFMFLEQEQQNHHRSLAPRIESLWNGMYETGFIEEGDVDLVQAWISDLTSINYSFPELLPHILSKELQHTTKTQLPSSRPPKCQEADSSTPPPRHSLLFPGVLLVVNYNTPYYETSCFLRKLWGGLFQDVVFFGQDSDEGYGILPANVSSDICARGVMNTCGIFFDASMERAITLFPGYKGYLFTHDDLVFNVHRMIRLDQNKIWTTNEVAWEGIFPNKPRTRHFVWEAMQESGCAAKMAPKGGYCRGTHDMYYVPARFAGDFARMARIFRYHGTESEGAGPTILRCISNEESDMETWVGRYEYHNRPGIADIFSLDYDFVHPTKFSNNNHLQDLAMDWMNQSIAMIRQPIRNIPGTTTSADRSSKLK